MTSRQTDPDGEARCIDWDVVRNLTGGDTDLVGELVELFPGECAKHLEAIQHAIEQLDGDALTRAAHTLKSSARLFGARSLANQALELELLGEPCRFEEARALLPDLEATASQVVAALSLGPDDQPGSGQE